MVNSSDLLIAKQSHTPNYSCITQSMNREELNECIFTARLPCARSYVCTMHLVNFWTKIWLYMQPRATNDTSDWQSLTYSRAFCCVVRFLRNNPFYRMCNLCECTGVNGEALQVHTVYQNPYFVLQVSWESGTTNLAIHIRYCKSHTLRFKHAMKSKVHVIKSLSPYYKAILEKISLVCCLRHLLLMLRTQQYRHQQTCDVFLYSFVLWWYLYIVL